MPDSVSVFCPLPRPCRHSTLQFTFEVSWEQTTKSFENRFDRYLDYEYVPSSHITSSVHARVLTSPCLLDSRLILLLSLSPHSFFGHQIHWFSIFNSTMMVVFLCGLVTLILFRTLRNDYARVSPPFPLHRLQHVPAVPDLPSASPFLLELLPVRKGGRRRRWHRPGHRRGLGMEAGASNRTRKYSTQINLGQSPGLHSLLLTTFSLPSRSPCALQQVHGDVFRAPVHLMLFSAIYGVGWQLTVLVLGVILFAIAGPIHGDVYEEVRTRRNSAALAHSVKRWNTPVIATEHLHKQAL